MKVFLESDRLILSQFVKNGEWLEENKLGITKKEWSKFKQ
jgi:hypothetical protein